MNDIDIARYRLESGAKWPYDAGQEFWESDSPPDPDPAIDWAHAAARGVLADLLDRRDIKWTLQRVDYDVRQELTLSMADIIREGYKQYANL